MTTTTSPAPALSARGLQKSFGGLPVLRGVDLRAERGTVLALLGSNGAGKTTVVKILSTLLRSDAGTTPVRCAARSASPGSSPPSTGC